MKKFSILIALICWFLLNSSAFAYGDYLLYSNIPLQIDLGRSINIYGKFINSDITKYEFWIEKPNGDIIKIPFTTDDSSIKFRYYPNQNGEYSIEMMYRNKYGPQVAFQKNIYVGQKPVQLASYQYNNSKSETYTTTNPQTQMLIYTNQSREEKNITPLQISSNLNTVASQYAQEIADTLHFEHTSKDGKTLLDRIFTKATKNKWGNKFGENLVIGTDTTDAFNKLMGSISHKNSILDSDFKYIGIGSAELNYNGKIYYVFVQNFAKKDI